MTDNFATVMNIEYGILVFVNRTVNRDSLSQLIFCYSNYIGLLQSTERKKMYVCIKLLSRKKVINCSRCFNITINNIYFLTLMPVIKKC